MTITLPQTVTLIDPGDSIDRYHNEVADWSTASRVTDVPFWIQERSSSAANAEGRDGVAIDLVGFCEADTEIRSGMRVEDAEEKLFEVDGHPRTLSTPAGPHHIEVRLKRVEG